MAKHIWRLAALALALGLAAPGAALADDRHGHHGGPQAYHHEHDWRSARRDFDRHRHHHRHRAERPYVVRPYAVLPYVPGPVVSGYGCHAVVAIDVIAGQRARVGATLCYDAYGQPFLLPGSRYVIGFLY